VAPAVSSSEDEATLVAACVIWSISWRVLVLISSIATVMRPISVSSSLTSISVAKSPSAIVFRVLSTFLRGRDMLLAISQAITSEARKAITASIVN